MSWVTRLRCSCRGLFKEFKSPVTNGFGHKFHDKAFSYKCLNVDQQGNNGTVGFIQLNSSKGYNYLNKQLLEELEEILRVFETDSTVGAVVVTGNERVFSAGADVPEMKDATFQSCYINNFPIITKCFTAFRKPIIAAVTGFALGGGCELAMSCDIIYAGKNAKFGQPEVLLGTIPGAGGTQNLVRAIGKSKAMEMCLSGSRISAKEALELGLVSKVVDTKECVSEAIKLGERIAKNSPLINMICKEAVLRGYNVGLTEGCKISNRLFHSTFATHDLREGMKAFVEKRPPKFVGS